MTDTGICSIRFAGTRLAIAWEGSGTLAVLEALFPTLSMASSSGSTAPPQPRYRLKSIERSERIELFGPAVHAPVEHLRTAPSALARGTHGTKGGQNHNLGEAERQPPYPLAAESLLYRGESAGTAAAMLLDCIVHDLVDDCLVGPVYHAAAVSYRGRGILMPGMSGAGKTTLSAWLAGKGWDYLSDEIACVERGSMKMEAFYRSLHLRTPIAAPLRQLIPAACAGPGPGNGRGIYRSAQGLILPIDHVHPANRYHLPRVRLIVFPRYLPGAGGECPRLSPARACSRLMACAVNVRNLPDHGLDAVAELARRVPAYALIYDRLDHLESRLSNLLHNCLQSSPERFRKGPEHLL